MKLKVQGEGNEADEIIVKYAFNQSSDDNAAKDMGKSVLFLSRGEGTRVSPARLHSLVKAF